MVSSDAWSETAEFSVGIADRSGGAAMWEREVGAAVVHGWTDLSQTASLGPGK